MNEEMNETPEKRKNTYVSLNEWLVKMRIAFGNAKLPAILSVLQMVGYTEEMLDKLLDELAALEGLCDVQKMETSEQIAETQRFNDKRSDVNETFLMHRNLCRVLFRKNVQAQIALSLNAPTKVAYANWLRLVEGFYSQLPLSDSLKTEVAKVGISEAVISAAVANVAEMKMLKDSQKKETSEAQASTEKRDQAFDALYEKYTELIGYAKALLKGDQALEALGIVVKR